MYRHSILFATDFSGRDHGTFKAACKLATGWDAKLLVLHVQDPRRDPFTVAKRKDPAEEFKKYIPEDIGISLYHFVKTGDPDKEILEFVKEHRIDMIVLGTHGRDGMERVFTGSIAEKIMRKADCPVMTLRETAETHASKASNILVPVDFSVYGYAALDFASKIALETGSKISIVFVDDKDGTATDEFPHGRPEMDDHQKRIWEQLKQFKPPSDRVSYIHKLLKGDPAKEIYDYANSKHFDYVILGTHGRAGVGRVLMGSVAEQVVRHANCPVISVKPTNKRSEVLVN